MSRVIKITTGVILLGISAFYLLGVCLVMKDAKEDAVYSLDYCLQVEQTGSEYLGENAEIYGEEKRALEGFGFYKLDFRVENLSTTAYHGGFSFLVDMYKETSAGKVGEVISDTEYYDYWMYGGSTPSLPGKTGADFTYYVEIKDGTEELSAAYRTAYGGEEKEIVIRLQ